MAWENAQIDVDGLVERLKKQIPEIERLEKLVPVAHHQALKKITLKRALKLYGDSPDLLAEELRLVRACIPKDEADFETLLEGAFVEIPAGFTYKPKLAECDLDSKMNQNPCSKNVYGVHAVNIATLEQYFRHGGIFPHYRGGKWRIEVTPQSRCFGMNGAGPSANASYRFNQRYADLHGFIGHLVAQRIIKHTRDDYFGRQSMAQADELYQQCVKHFLEGDGLSHQALRQLFVSRFGDEAGVRIFREAIGEKGVRIQFNERITHYFQRSEKLEGAYAEPSSAAGSIVLAHNQVLPFDAVYGIRFNGGRRQAREFRKLIAQPSPPRSIFRMYLK